MEEAQISLDSCSTSPALVRRPPSLLLDCSEGSAGRGGG